VTAALARKQFTEFKERREEISDAELDDFWTTLEPTTIDFMIGEWKGGEFHTGHKTNGFMEGLNWFGKTFYSATDAKPLVCLAPRATSSPTPRR
jgi:GXWXG protein